MSNPRKSLGVIGGSGIYEFEGLENRKEVALETPFGPPSDVVMTGEMFGVSMAFLPRHGRGHRIAPNELPFRANIHAVKQLGMDCVLGVSAVGSMKAELQPGHFVLIDQFIDRTRGRTHESTFFGDGCVAHAHFADPVWEPLRKLALQAARQAGAHAHDGGTYICMEGPHFSTRAESRLYRSWGASVIGMTNLQEAKLAREAEIAYATIALVTDYDCWHEIEGDVDVAKVLAVIKKNGDLAHRTIVEAVRLVSTCEPISAAGSMNQAVMTAPDKVTPDARMRLKLMIDQYLG